MMIARSYKENVVLKWRSLKNRSKNVSCTNHYDNLNLNLGFIYLFVSGTHKRDLQKSVHTEFVHTKTLAYSKHRDVNLKEVDLCFIFYFTTLHSPPLQVSN